MDRQEVESRIGEGTIVQMWKSFGVAEQDLVPILQAAVWNSSGRV